MLKQNALDELICSLKSGFLICSKLSFGTKITVQFVCNLALIGFQQQFELFFDLALVVTHSFKRHKFKWQKKLFFR